jgi:very-short-patch-repair endonuclease
MSDVFEQGKRRILAEYSDVLDMWRAYAVKQVESPIEGQMVDALLVCSAVSPSFMCTVHHGKAGIYENDGFHLLLQRQVGPYRPDIAVIWNVGNNTHLHVIVECDGHAFHEKTKEQAARDKARDRFLMIKGWPVLRFTGSEIHRDAAACAEAVVDALHTQWQSGGGHVEDLQRIFDT